MHWKNLVKDDYKYLGSYSLEDEPNKTVTLTIKNVRIEKVTGENGREDTCRILDFEEDIVGTVLVKPMVCNKTNCKTIEAIYDTGDTDDWIGKRVTLFVTTTRTKDGTVPCLRIKREVPPSLTCSICGKVISQKLHDASIKKYGVAICSRECLEKYKENEEGETK